MDAIVDECVTLYHNEVGYLYLKTLKNGTYVLHVYFECESVSKVKGMEMLAALEAFYKMNTDKQFVQLYEFHIEYVPSPDLIMATLNLMREMHAYFQTHLHFTCVVAGSHADMLRKYMRNWTPTRPVHYLHSTGEIYTLFN